MPCCKCNTSPHWLDPQPVIYSDDAGLDYCLFHAPAEHKGMSVEDFNAQVFARIDAVKQNNTTEGKEKDCDLSGAVFPGDISFRAYGENNPLPSISLLMATFDGKPDFFNATFGGQANFVKATFGGEAHFYTTKFGGKAYFIGATFGGMAVFEGAKFGGEAYFGGATFGDEALSAVTMYGGMANFGNAKFGGYAYFAGATFTGEARFSGATFSDTADFRKATFTKEAHFDRVKTNQNSLRLHSLNSATLTHLNFTSLETEFFSFKGCYWPDQLWPETREKPDYKACEELYRSLKQKAATEHDQPLVSKWHYREKLMALEQIKAKRGWIGSLGLTGLYYWCSGFGEDPAQAFRVLAGLLGVAFLALCGFKLGETGHSWQPAWDKILEIPAELLALIPFVKTEAKAFSNASGMLAPAKAIVTGLLHILFATQIALFAFALRNRFRR